MLNETDIRILQTLSEVGGFTTGKLREMLVMPGFKAASLRQNLLHLQKEGLVAPMDDLKPVCWVRTKKGTEALK